MEFQLTWSSPAPLPVCASFRESRVSSYVTNLSGLSTFEVCVCERRKGLAEGGRGGDGGVGGSEEGERGSVYESARASVCLVSVCLCVCGVLITRGASCIMSMGDQLRSCMTVT